MRFVRPMGRVLLMSGSLERYALLLVASQLPLVHLRSLLSFLSSTATPFRTTAHPRSTYLHPPAPRSTRPPTNKENQQVLTALQQKSILLPETLQELESVLKDRDIAATHPFTATSNTSGTADSTTPSQQNTHRPSRNGTSLEKRQIQQIQQRIEEDRERHKRLRESIWAVPGEGDEEMERVWGQAEVVGDEIAEDDYVEALEGMEERRRVVENC